ncbi:MAG TPA: ABC transporter ATP-binding protein [Candidatus Saccharimonadales bacterium]|nr:ABC transporter ATP-binding protein [Candidatus Saccharimonadales bacterium]
MAAEEEVLGKAYDRRIVRRLMGYLSPYSLQVALALAAIVLKAGADVLGPYLTKTAIDKYLSSQAGGHSFLDRFLSSQPMVGIAQISGLFLGVLLLGFLFEFTQTYLMQWTGQKVMFDLRSQLYRHLQRMDISFFDRNPVGRLVTRVTTDVDALNEMFTSGVVSIVEDIFVLAGILWVMLSMSWRLALIAFIVMPIIIIATQIFRKSVRDSYRRIRVAIARINSFLQEHISGIVPLQLFNRERKSFEEFEAVNAQHMNAFKDAILAYALYYPVVETLSSIAIACVLWYGGHSVLSGITTLGVLVAFMQYAQRFFRPIQDLSEKLNILQSAMAAGERVFKTLDTEPKIQSPAIEKEPQGPGRIEFDNVWFAYRHIPVEKDGKAVPSEEWDWILRGVSFTIEPGETVAIVGHTGAGKTTLISLLLRFYDVQKGAIRIDGVDVREMNLQKLRRRCGVVLQDPFLFSGTIVDNIKLGSEHVTREAVERAAEEVNVADFIQSLPQGFDSPLQERGNTLSTGQKQLVSFARALAHNPRILILDEATSSVDTDTEFRVREALTRLVEGRTSLIIAHRLSTIQRADKIIVMHKGKVREMGTHQQLLTMKGVYWKLYQLQYKDQELGSPLAAAPVQTGPEARAD